MSTSGVKKADDSFLAALEEPQDAGSRAFRASVFKQLMGLIVAERWIFWFGISMVLLGTFATLLEPRVFGYAIDDALIPKRPELLTRYAVIFLAVVCARIGTSIAQSYLFEVLGQRVTQRLRVRLFSHLMRLPMSVYDRNPAGRLLTRVTNDVASLSEMFSAGFVAMISNALVVVGILAWLLVLDLRLGLIAAAVFPLLVVISVILTRRLRDSYTQSRSKLSALNAFLAENLNGMKVVQSFNRKNLHLERFDRVSHWYADALISTVRTYAFFQPAITIAAGVSASLVIVYGGWDVSAGRLPVGVLVAFFSYVLSLFQPVREIADKWNVFLSGMVSAERIFSILAWPTEDPAAGASRVEEPAVPLDGFRGEIVFENVWFAYDSPAGGSEPRWVLRDFSVRIPAGTRVGVVGHTGAGKTTLISLLMRFYEPQRGRILIDGRDIREYDRRRLRASIGIIQQDAFVFSGSLKDNVTFWQGDRAPGAADASAALARLGFDSFWRDDATELQERGSNLSMGERQVLAFARALAARPAVWILDEATANLDSDTELKLQHELARSARDRTAILIAHRLATVKSADLILVLHKGALQESGSHAELLKVEGLYARLYRFQQAEDATGNPQ